MPSNMTVKLTMDEAALIQLDGDMRAVIEAQKLCFAATVTPDGRD